MKKLFFVLLTSVMLASCDKGDETPNPIELTGGTSTTQTVYADDTQKQDGIKFNATAPWTATVNEVAMNKAGGNGLEWLTLSAYEGKAGEQSITLTLLPNITGSNRKAEIKITCANTTITITVEQKATTQSGEKPEPIARYITATGKITGGEIFGENTPTTLQWAIRSTNGNQEVLSSTSFPYINKNFDITLPQPAETLLGSLTDQSVLSIIPNTAKFVSAVLYNQHSELELTNIAPQNVNNDSYLIKKGEGYVKFIYASKPAIVNGNIINEEEDFAETLKFNNCQFRQGWNEVVVIAEENALINGSVRYIVSTNNAPATFKWVATDAR